MSEQQPPADHSNHEAGEAQVSQHLPVPLDPSDGNRSDSGDVSPEDSREDLKTSEEDFNHGNAVRDIGNDENAPLDADNDGSLGCRQDKVVSRSDHQPFLFIEQPNEPAVVQPSDLASEDLHISEKIAGDEQAATVEFVSQRSEEQLLDEQQKGKGALLENDQAISAEKHSGQQDSPEFVTSEIVTSEGGTPEPEMEQDSDEQDSDEQEPVKKQGSRDSEVVFSELDLSQAVLQAVKMTGYENPTPIQAQIIPHLLGGRDVLAQSQTGTGKTAAFALPILSRIKHESQTPQVLVLAPTRELAIQVADSFSTYAACMKQLSVATIYGGQSYEPQLRQLRGGAQIVVGTPGRVMDHMRRGTLNLKGVDCLVLDEADEMLSMGFLEDVLLILEHTPSDRQIALFSATVPDAIREIAQQHLNDPVHIKVKKKTMTADSIRHRALMMAPRDKIYALGRMIEAEETDGIIVFTKTKAATLTVAETLCRQGRSAVALNGDMPQATRERTIEQFKSGRLDILVATDVAARGLDVSRVSHVFNFDLPHDVESYIHRVGRTGRAGRAGEAIIFLSRSQRGRLRTIERVTNQKIEIVDLPTTDDINQLRVKRFEDRITDVISQHDLTLFKKLIDRYSNETGKPLEMIAAALAHLNQQGRPFLEKDRPQKKRRDKDHWSEDEPKGRSRRGEDGVESRDSRSSRPRKPRRSGPPEAGMQRYRIEVGRRDGVRPGNIVGAVANEAGIEGEFIGPITINDSYSTIDLPDGMPTDIYQSLRRTRVVGKPLQIKLQDGKRGEGSSEEGSRPRGQERRRGPAKGKSRGAAKGKSHGKKNGGFQQSQFSKPAKAKKKGKKKQRKTSS